jgi:hypothetical protein
LTFPEYLNIYRREVEKGAIQKAYKLLMDSISTLKSNFEKKYPDFFISEIYHGYMDMTYFSFTPQSIKNLKLKIAIVFIHNRFVFEVWLVGQNKQIQAEYWRIVKEKKWSRYQVPDSIEGIDYIMKNVLLENPNFGDLDNLSINIDAAAIRFIDDLEKFLLK